MLCRVGQIVYLLSATVVCRCLFVRACVTASVYMCACVRVCLSICVRIHASTFKRESNSLPWPGRQPIARGSRPIPAGSRPVAGPPRPLTPCRRSIVTRRQPISPGNTRSCVTRLSNHKTTLHTQQRQSFHLSAPRVDPWEGDCLSATNRSET